MRVSPPVVTSMPNVPSLRLLSPAKLNLHLEVLGRREDGYHNLETLLSTVTIFDAIKLSGNTNGAIQLRCRWLDGLAKVPSGIAQRREQRGDQSGQHIEASSAARYSPQQINQQTAILGDLPPEDENLIYRAAELMRNEVQQDRVVSRESARLMQQGVSLDVVKRIPSAAGLGGASSNAATTILALNRFWKLAWPAERLAEIAARLGSDIPFFIYGGAAICRGRGEIVDPVKFRGPLHIVVVRPPAGLSTARVFSSLEQTSYEPRSVEPILQALSHGNMAKLAGQLFNRLQQVATHLCQWIKVLQKEFANVGCVGHQMTGSGSCYFGIGRNRQHALHLYHRLQQRRLGWVHLCRTG